MLEIWLHGRQVFVTSYARCGLNLQAQLALLPAGAAGAAQCFLVSYVPLGTMCARGLQGYSEREKQYIDMERMAYQIKEREARRERDQMEDRLEDSEAKRERLVVDAAVTTARLVERENLLVDFRNWEKAVKRFFSALKGSNALDRTVLCKDPEGVIEKILEGKTFDLDEVEVMRNRNLKVWKPAPEELDLAWAASRLHLAEKESLAAENERLRARVEELEASQ